MSEVEHGSSVSILFGALAFILISARFANRIATRIGLPSVLGELILGILLGVVPGFSNYLLNHPAFVFMMEVGALLLLFEVGLESSFSELRRVGASAGRVAVAGVVAPFALGVSVSMLLGAVSLLPGHLFIGATLAATSVGITARVLRDLGQSHSSEAKVILAAAVFDDILGLVLLAFVTALVDAANGGELSAFSIASILGKSLLFIMGIVAFGRWILPGFLYWCGRLLGKGSLLTVSLGLCLAFSMLAHIFGLAPIIGAFFAGLIIQPNHFASFRQPTHLSVLEDQLEPLSSVFVPLFFVLTGMKVDLRVFVDWKIFQLGLLLTAAAILGKVASGFFVGKGCNPLIVGVGMVPRGEVGLIFASLGASLTLGGNPLLSATLFGALIAMVTLTSIVSPIWLGYLLRNKTPSAKGRSAE